MQNDGYIVGTYSGTDTTAGVVWFNEQTEANIRLFGDVNNLVFNASLYAPKDTVVSTRSNGGTYNLTIYEWK